MELEKEITQKEFRNEKSKMIINVIFTSNWLLLKLGKTLRQHSLTWQQYNILKILKDQYPKPAMVNLLIDKMLDKSSNASRIVEKLRIKGLVDRQIRSEDRRAVDIQLTDQGLSLLDKVEKDLKKLEDSFSDISESDIKKVNQALDKLRG
jgi:DNA-binding MarR family transcriptional regulator